MHIRDLLILNMDEIKLFDECGVLLRRQYLAAAEFSICAGRVDAWVMKMVQVPSLNS